MHDLTLLLTFTGGLAAALVFGYIAQRLKLSPIVGYLLAGILVGPFTPGFVADRAVAEQFAEIGVILLLFGIGLKFNLRELIAVWRIAIPGALIQSALSTGMLAVLLHLMGWTWSAGIVLGLAISVASTVVMALVLAERGDLHAPIGYIAIGWTVVEDLITVTLLLLLPMIFGPKAADSLGAGAALGVAGLKVIGLGITVWILARWVIPWALEQVERTRSRELFTLAVLVIALGIAFGSAEVFGVSMALGAFLGGLAVGRSDFAARAASDALPMRDAFAVLFFVSVGMLCDPRLFLAEPLLIAAVLAVVVIGKPLAGMLVVSLSGRPFATAVGVGAALSQVGEFSFILGVVALELGVINDAGWNAMVAASIISISLNPTIYRRARKWVASAPSLQAAKGGAEPVVDPRRCVLVGYGPVGRTVHRLLTDYGTDVTVIELNLETVRALRSEGVAAVYGDVLRAGTLEEAEIATAGSLILSAEIEDAAELVRQARAANPSLRVLARCANLRGVEALRRTGATVIAGEAEVAVALAEALIVGNAEESRDLNSLRVGIRDRLYDVPGSAA
ncbi:MAG TPA: cation:proton antiporter [Vulgatibacter sp.]